MNLKSLVPAVLALSFLAAPLQARMGGDVGLGFQIGNPTGFAAKFWTSGVNAIDLGLGFHLGRNDVIVLKADYLWHHFNVIPVNAGQLPLYYGMGASVRASNDPAVGMQGSLGLAYSFPAAPLDLFLTISPGIWVFPEPDANIGVGLGMRWFF